MKIHAKYQTLAQGLLVGLGAAIKVDGDFGTFSDQAADRINGINLSPERQVALTIQKAYNRKAEIDIKEDGWWGPDTEAAADSLLGVPMIRPDESGQQCHDGKCSLVRCWTPTDAQMRKRYGDVGTRQKTILVPFPLRLDWDRATIVNKMTVHELVADRCHDALEETLATFGREKIEAMGLHYFGGSLNVRKKRGGSTWSAHAWGTAHDWWPSRNGLKESHKSAEFAKAIYAPWFEIWERHGFMSLGRCFDFDWMHLQANPD